MNVERRQENKQRDCVWKGDRKAEDGNLSVRRQRQRGIRDRLGLDPGAALVGRHQQYVRRTIYKDTPALSRYCFRFRMVNPRGQGRVFFPSRQDRPFFFIIHFFAPVFSSFHFFYACRPIGSQVMFSGAVSASCRERRNMVFECRFYKPATRSM